MKGFRVEQSDVLLSIQMVLTREEEARRRALARGAAPNALHPPHPVRPARPAAVPVRSAPPPGSVTRAAPPHPAAPAPPRASIASGTRPPAAPMMVDPLTGVGTIHALRRDLMLQQAWPSGMGQTPVLWALEVAPLDRIRSDQGPEAADHVLKVLVEVAPFALRTQDRVYRSGRNQLTLLLPGADQAGAEGARTALEAALQRRMAGRGYPEVRLLARRLDPIALAS